MMRFLVAFELEVGVSEIDAQYWPSIVKRMVKRMAHRQEVVVDWIKVAHLESSENLLLDDKAVSASQPIDC